MIARATQPGCLPPWAPPAPGARAARRGFTLVELLITISIIGILASMVLFALFAAQEEAKRRKTQSLITSLDTIIQERYQQYRTRRVPIRLGADDYIDANNNNQWDSGESVGNWDFNGNGQYDPDPVVNPSYAQYFSKHMARYRLESLRDLMRMELPDRWSDVVRLPVAPYDYGPGTRLQPPGAWQAYRAHYRQIMEPIYGTSWQNLPPPGKVAEHQGAECLYMVINQAVAADGGDARDFFKPGDVGDVDGDGFPEFLDGWGRPIRFLRWAPGYLSDLHEIASAVPNNVVPNGQVVTLTFNTQAALFSRDPSRYVGGAVAVLESGTGRMLANRLGKISSFQYDDSGTVPITDDIVTILCETPAAAPTPFSPGGPPTAGTDRVAIMPPDPFDSRGIYPVYGSLTSWQTPTFALYPLIYSSGPDRCFGVRTEPQTGGLLVYSNNGAADPGLTPFFANVDHFIGEPWNFDGTGGSGREEFYTPSGWLDNITNHQLNTR